MSVFDIPEQRLSELTDADSRELIARLCEAERERQGGNRNEIRWGGQQAAPDGGIDVAVSVATGAPFQPGAPLERRLVGIQVKKRNLGRSKILAEMRRGKALKPEIARLAARGGSYVIASLGANCSESMLATRIHAMRDAVVDDPNASNLGLTFLDRKAIGRWVSAHPSVAAWVRMRLGLPLLANWQPYGRWSSTPENVPDDLICDDGLVFHLGQSEPIRNIPDALDAIRKLVMSGKGAVRIAGLSGLGKSRIVQALFEPVGRSPAMPQSYAVYTDLGANTDPVPEQMLDELICMEAPAILVVDNCPSDTHQALARKRSQRGGSVKLITVEHDVRLDRPEETDAVRVEAEASHIVAKLLGRRYGNLDGADRYRLANLSLGNARLGLALADAAPETGSLSSFDDTELFGRLFWQSQTPNEDLARAAEALSLVYSFDVEGERLPDELAFLGSLVGLDRKAMFRHASDLFGRKLAQSRGRWRALLPHALANRLARQALERIHWKEISDGFADKPRLRQSLSRRLAFLHDSEKAKYIAARWMETGGPLHGPEPDLVVLSSLCRLVSAETLEIAKGVAAAVAANAPHPLNFDLLTKCVARIALDRNLFAAACDCLVALSITVEEHLGSISNSELSHLFQLHLSGAQAKTDARIAVARKYLLSDDPRCSARGLTMLRAALKTSRWEPSSGLFDGAVPGAHGWEPTKPEIADWFSCWLDLVVEVGERKPEGTATAARTALADELAHIWIALPDIRGKLGDVARQLHDSRPWLEGRVAFQSLLRNAEGDKNSGFEPRFKAIRDILADMEPADLASRALAELMDETYSYALVLDDLRNATILRAGRLRQLGSELAAAPDVLASIATELLGRQWRAPAMFGTGLGEGNGDVGRVWEILRDTAVALPELLPDSRIFPEFLHALDERDPDLARQIRAECRSIPTFRQIYPDLLPRGTAPAEEIDAVIEIVSECELAAMRLGPRIWSNRLELGDDQRRHLLRAMANTDFGAFWLIDALNMLIHDDGAARAAWLEDSMAVAMDAVIALVASGKPVRGNAPFIATTLSACLDRDVQANAERFMDAIAARAARPNGDVTSFLDELFEVARRAPLAFLSKVFPDDLDEPTIGKSNYLGGNPLMHVPSGELIRWCNELAPRWSKVARQVTPFDSGRDGGEGSSAVAPLACDFLLASPLPGEVVEAYVRHIVPKDIWVGNLNDFTDLVERRLASIEELRDHPASEVGATIDRLAPQVWAEKEEMLLRNRSSAKEWQRFE